MTLARGRVTDDFRRGDLETIAFRAHRRKLSRGNTAIAHARRFRDRTNALGILADHAERHQGLPAPDRYGVQSYPGATNSRLLGAICCSLDAPCSDVANVSIPVGGLTVYCFGDPRKMSDESSRLALRIHDEVSVFQWTRSCHSSGLTLFSVQWQRCLRIRYLHMQTVSHIRNRGGGQGSPERGKWRGHLLQERRSSAWRSYQGTTHE